MPRRMRPTFTSLAGPILQLKMRLLGISPMIWRRVLVPVSLTIQELHGVIQAAMGWEGLHLYEVRLRAARYGSPELCTDSADVPLESFRFRRHAKLTYIYDMGAWWEHKLRIEDRLEAETSKRYPLCLDEQGACPPEDCGGPEGYRARRDEASASLRSMTSTRWRACSRRSCSTAGMSCSTIRTGAAPKLDQRHDGGSPIGLRRLSPPESSLRTGALGRPRASGMRKATDKAYIPSRMMREPTPSGECRLIAKAGRLMKPLSEPWMQTLELLLKIAAAAVAAFWALYVWRVERERDRQARLTAEQRARHDEAARYIIPFLRAAEDLQSRLYNVLARGGLGALRDQYPDGAYAYEILYEFSRFFGWLNVIERYSEYSRDQEIINKAYQIRQKLATGRHGWARALRLYRPQQRNLGQIAVGVAGNLHGPFFFDVVSFEEFVYRLENGNFPGQNSLKEFIDLIRQAKSPPNLGGGEYRLAEIQILLADLLDYMEYKEGIQLLPADSKRERAAAPPRKPG